jgi:hypothetical protein
MESLAQQIQQRRANIYRDRLLRAIHCNLDGCVQWNVSRLHRFSSSCWCLFAQYRNANPKDATGLERFFQKLNVSSDLSCCSLLGRTGSCR